MKSMTVMPACGGRRLHHDVPVEFLGRRMTIEIAFIPTADKADLVGMRGFFDQMTIAFDHAARRVYVAFAQQSLA